MFIAGLDLCSERNVIDQHFLHFGVHQLIAVICLLSELECRRLKVLKFFLHKFNQRTATHGFSTERFRKVERVASCLFRSFAVLVDFQRGQTVVNNRSLWRAHPTGLSAA